MDRGAIGRHRWRCYRFGITVGISSLLRGNFKIGLKQALFPINYWRTPVFPLVAQALDGKTDLRVLDIGSPKLLALYLAARHGHVVHATDLQDEEIFTRFSRHYQDLPERSRRGAYIAELKDARRLDYPDQHFDAVYSVSVIEHIPDDGDTLAMQEIARVLRPGGVAVVEVPFAREARDQYLNARVYEREYQDEPVFYQRLYDPATVQSRLLQEGRLRLEDVVVVVERLPWSRIWGKVPGLIQIPLLWSEAVASRLNHGYLFTGTSVPEDVPGDRGMNITLFFRKA